MMTRPSARILGAVVALVISALLLSSHISLLQPSLPHSKDQPINHLTSKPSLIELSSVFNIQSDDDFKNIAAQFGHHDHPVNASTSQHRHVKRVQVLNYAYAVCKGRRLWGDIQAAFNGQRPPGEQFGQVDFDNSWTLEPIAGQLPRGGHWENAFRSFAVGVPMGPYIQGLSANQDKTFKNVAGRNVVTPTGAKYTLQYVPGWSTMLATFVQSPSARLADNTDSPYGHPVDAIDIPTLIPPMHRLSDVSWYVWSRVSAHPAQLRYIGHDFVINGDTESIMEYLSIVRFGEDAPFLDWPGLVYDIDSDEAKALLATPNSLAIAYMMMDHAAELGRRLPRVYIFKDNRGIWSMLWDLFPV